MLTTIEILKYAQYGISCKLNKEYKVKEALNREGKKAPIAEHWIEKLETQFKELGEMIKNEENKAM